MCFWTNIDLFGNINGSDIDLNTWELNYPYVENGSSSSLFVEVTNNGNATLTISDNYTTNSQFTIVNPLTSLAPGESQNVEIIYNASSLNAAGVYRIYTNDTDEPLVMCEVNNADGTPHSSNTRAQLHKVAEKFNYEL